MQLDSINDKADYKTVNDAIKSIGFTRQASTFWKIVASVIHLVSLIWTIFGIIYRFVAGAPVVNGLGDGQPSGVYRGGCYEVK